MYCTNCGFKNEDNVNFCASCGNKITVNESSPVTLNKKPKNQSSKKGLYIILSIVVCVALVVTSILFFYPGSLEKQLTENKWWTKVRVSCEANEYDSRYTVLIYCDRYIFCPTGTVRQEGFDMGWGAYYSSYKVTKDNIPSYYEFQEAGSGNNRTWELLEDDVLLFDDKYYEWSKTKAEDTWYLDGDNLRIGTLYLTTTEPENKLSDDAERPPYWCTNCGEDGPYDIKCPECGSKEKTKCDW